MKDVNSIKGIHSVKLSHTAPQKSSIPLTRSSKYLKCYMICTEKERLFKERERHRIKIDSVEKRIEYIHKRIGRIDKELMSLEKNRNIRSAAESAHSESLLNQDKKEKEKVKKFSLHY